MHTEKASHQRGSWNIGCLKYKSGTRLKYKLKAKTALCTVINIWAQRYAAYLIERELKVLCALFPRWTSNILGMMCRAFAFRVFHNILYTVMFTDITRNENGKRVENFKKKKWKRSQSWGGNFPVISLLVTTNMRTFVQALFILTCPAPRSRNKNVLYRICVLLFTD
jgi:hypothetical protein